MENTNRDTAQNAVPQNDWQDAETAKQQDESGTATHYNNEQNDEHIHAMAGISAPDPEDEDEDEDDNNEEDESGDWGHTDPAEGNSPFPDSNDPSGPGSAV